MHKDDYVLTMRISEMGLAEGKRPPLCDGCNAPIPRDEPKSSYAINCLILDGERFYGVECNECVARYFSKMPKVSENDAPKELRQTVRLELAQDVQVTFF